MRNGFTLIEALIAISILIIGILSGFILVTRALYNVSVIQDRLTASFLAQEGIELVRNIRDTNYVKILNGQSSGDWRKGLADGCYTIGYNINSKSIQLNNINNCTDDNNYGPPLYYDPSNNLYLYTSGINNQNLKQTSFYRRIEIQTVQANEIRVFSSVKWKTKNIDFNLQVEDHLFNWFNI